MRVLLDTHTLLWFLTDDARLGRRALALISSDDNEVLVSVASLWEIAIKHALGKLPLDRPFAETFPAQLVTNKIDLLPISTAHLARLVDLPHRHRDPFDRLIVAQALVEGVPLLTRDGALARYGVETVWS